MQTSSKYQDIQPTQWWQRFAIVEIDEHTITSALELVRDLSTQDINDFRGYEKHPAVLALTSWWNDGPGKTLKRAGYFKVYQRVGKADKHPHLRGTSDLAGMKAFPNMRSATAFLAPDIFFVFHVSQSTNERDDQGYIYLPLVNDLGFDGTAGPPEDYHNGTFDEAYFCLIALQSIAKGEPIGWYDC